MLWAKKIFPNTFQNIIVCGLLLVGLLLPTAIFGWMKAEVIYLAPLTVLLFLLFLRNKPNLWQIVIGVVLITLLGIFTLTSSLRFSFGEAVYYVMVFVVLILIFQLQYNQEELKISQSRIWALGSLSMASWLLILVGYSVVVHFSPVTDFLIEHYRYYYGGLIESQTYQGKPSLMFTTHSVAGFYFFLFTMMNLYAFMKEKDAFYLLQSLLLMGLLVALRSTTSLVYLGMAMIAYLVVSFLWSKKVFYLSLGLAFIGGLFLSWRLNLFTLLKDNLFGKNSVNGLAIRYKKGGTLYPQIQNVLKHPIVGSGTRSIDGVIYIDSGIFHLMQRIGVPGAILFYLGFYRMLRRNLARNLTIGLFLIFFSFEIGFANFFYFRTLYLLPFIVFFFASLEGKENKLFQRSYQYESK